MEKQIGEKMKKETIKQAYERSHKDEFSKADAMSVSYRDNHLRREMERYADAIHDIAVNFVGAGDTLSLEDVVDTFRVVMMDYKDMSDLDNEQRIISGDYDEPHPDFSRFEQIAENLLEKISVKASELGGEI